MIYHVKHNIKQKQHDEPTSSMLALGTEGQTMSVLVIEVQTITINHLSYHPVQSRQAKYDSGLVACEMKHFHLPGSSFRIPFLPWES